MGTPSEVPHDFCCPICYEVFVDPVCMSCCGKAFDKVCLESYFNTQDVCTLDEVAARGCPNCRSVDFAPFTVAIDLRNIVETWYPQEVHARRQDQDLQRLFSKFVQLFVDMKNKNVQSSCFSYKVDGISLVQRFWLDHGTFPESLNLQLQNAAVLWMDAIHNEECEFIQFLLKNQLIAVNNKQYTYDTDDECFPLGIAIDMNAINIVRVLLSYGAQVNQLLPDGNSPLLLALKRSDVDLSLVDLLLEHGADVHAIDSSKNSTLHATVRFPFSEKSLCVAKRLLSAGVDINAMNAFYETSLYKACGHGFLALADLLIQYGATMTLNLSSPTNFPTCISEIWIACSQMHLPIVQLLWDVGQRFEPLEIVDEDRLRVSFNIRKFPHESSITPLSLVLHNMGFNNEKKQRHAGLVLVDFLVTHIPSLLHMQSPILLAGFYGYTSLVKEWSVLGAHVDSYQLLLCMSEHNRISAKKRGRQVENVEN